MNLEDENGLETSGSPSDEVSGSELEASPASNDSDSGSSPEEENQTSLEALEDALTNADEEGGDDSGGSEDGKPDEGKPSEEAAADGDTDAGAKPDDSTDEDELLKPLPEGTPEKTAERFEKLTEGYKSLKENFETVTTESEKYKAYHDDFNAIVQHSQATPEEFNELIEYSRLVKTGNLEEALAVLDQQRSLLAVSLGKPVPGVDLFSDHPDLQEQLDMGMITEEHAAELVQSRNVKAEQLKHQQKQNVQQNQERQSQQSNEAFETDVSQATQDIGALVAGWEKNDINFSSKKDAILKKVQEIGQKYEPKQWAEILELQYNAIKVEGRTRRSTKPNPLRTGSGVGGKKEATTSLDAVSDALNSL